MSLALVGVFTQRNRSEPSGRLSLVVRCALATALLFPGVVFVRQLLETTPQSRKQPVVGVGEGKRGEPCIRLPLNSKKGSEVKFGRFMIMAIGSSSRQDSRKARRKLCLKGPRM